MIENNKFKPKASKEAQSNGMISKESCDEATNGTGNICTSRFVNVIKMKMILYNAILNKLQVMLHVPTVLHIQVNTFILLAQ